MAAKQNGSTLMKWVGRILTVLVILAFLPSSVLKIMHYPMAVEGFASMGLPADAIMPIGIVELVCLILYLIPQTTVLGTLLLTGYLGGAILANLIGGNDYIHALVVGAFVWAGAWCRVPEFRDFIPVQKSRGAAS